MIPHLDTDKELQFLLMIGVGVLGLFYLMGYDLIEGDPTIYFSFLPHMFSSPFSFGQEGRVSFGATSPMYAIAMAAIYPLAQSAQDFLVIAKIASAISLLLALGYMTLSLKTLCDKEKLAARSAAYCILIPFVLVPSLFYQSVFLFETPLVLLYSSVCLFFLLRERYFILLLVLPLSYLIRPEVVLLQLAFGATALWELWKQEKLGPCILLALLQFAPMVGYHWYMFEHTDRIIPTSVESRASRSGHDLGLIKFAYAFVGNYHFLSGIGILTGLMLSRQVNVRPLTNALSPAWLPYFAAGCPLVLLAIAPTLPARYFDFLLPLLIVFCGRRLATQWISCDQTQSTTDERRSEEQGLTLRMCLVGAGIVFVFVSNEVLFANNYLMWQMAGPVRAIFYVLFLSMLTYLLVRLKGRSARVTAITLIIFVNCHVFAFGPYSLNSKIDNRLDDNFGAAINDLLVEDETLLMYEIQLQYTTSRKILSMDGIVGNGEFLEFYKGIEPFGEALKRNGVKYIGIDEHGAAPPMLSDDESRLLFENYIDLPVGGSVRGRYFEYTKVLENSSDIVYPMWHTIFRVDSL